MEFAERLRQQRSKLGLTQQQVADRIGVEVSTYAKYENGTNLPNSERAKELCALLEIPFKDHFPLVRNLEFHPEQIQRLSVTKERVGRLFAEGTAPA